MITATDRKRFIGGTDAAGILGLSRWSSPLSVWAEKTGLVDSPDISDRLAVKLGTRLEQTVCDLWEEETGKKLHRVNETIFHPKYDFIGGHLDRRVVGEKSIFEAKTASAWKAKEWEGEEMPREYVIQCLHYLAVTGAERCYLACLIGNEKFIWKTIERDEQALANLVNREVSFWNDFVLTKAMPMQMTGREKDTLDSLFPTAEEGKTVDLPARAAMLIDSIGSLRQDLKNVEKLIAQDENELRAMLGDAEAGVIGDKKIFWANVKTKRLDMDELKEKHPAIYTALAKEKIYRKFLIKELKENPNGNGK